MWTHIIGAIHIDTFKEFSEDILLELPAITDCQVDVTIENGYNTFEDNVEYQTCAIITLYGDCRNCTIEEAKEEVAAFVDYIDEHFYILNKSIKITNEEEIIQW